MQGLIGNVENFIACALFVEFFSLCFSSDLHVLYVVSLPISDVCDALTPIFLLFRMFYSLKHVSAHWNVFLTARRFLLHRFFGTLFSLKKHVLYALWNDFHTAPRFLCAFFCACTLFITSTEGEQPVVLCTDTSLLHVLPNIFNCSLHFLVFRLFDAFAPLCQDFFNVFSQLLYVLWLFGTFYVYPAHFHRYLPFIFTGFQPIFNLHKNSIVIAKDWCEISVGFVQTQVNHLIVVKS